MAVSEFARLVWFLLGTLVFIILMAVDIHKAIKKGAHWVPGNALVLSALSIQIMKFIEDQSNQALLGQNSSSSETLEGENNFIMIHSSRVMLCVLVALFLPGMAGGSNEEKWTKIVALGISVIFDIFSELLTLYRRFSGHSFSSFNGVSWDAFLVSDSLIMASLIWLILLLFCVAGASKSIRNITTQRIPFILAEPADQPDVHVKKNIEHQVFKSWIVARVCSPESIITKSMLVSSAALVVTVCISSSVVGWIVHGPSISIPSGAKSSLKFIITFLEFVFILVGWFVIVLRSLTSIRFYGGCSTENSSWFQQFLKEDFWTKRILEDLRDEDLKVHSQIEDFWTEEGIMYDWTRQMQEKESKKTDSEKKIIQRITEKRWAKRFILGCLGMLLTLVVFFTKVSQFLIKLMFYNAIIRRIEAARTKPTQLPKSLEEAILENMSVVGETRGSLLATNRMAIIQAHDHLQKGQKDARHSPLIKFLKRRPSPPQKLPPLRVGVGSSDPQTAEGLKFLRKIESSQEHIFFFKYMRERAWSWKLTAVSLINIIFFGVSRPCARDSVEAYTEAWQLMDLVDEWDPNTNSLLSDAADREFNTLMHKTSCGDFYERYTPIAMTEVAENIKKLKETKMSTFQTESGKLEGNKKTGLAAESNREDKADYHHKKLAAVDWEKLAGAIALYKLYECIDCSVQGDSTEIKTELEGLLGDVISACIAKVGTALKENCMKWAQNLEEEKLLQAIYMAGKFSGLVAALEWNLQIDPTTAESSESSMVAPAGSSMV